jgi:hypothetical protein
MKVDWDKIIKNYKPSRESRRLAKMVGGGDKEDFEKSLLLVLSMMDPISAIAAGLTESKRQREERERRRREQAERIASLIPTTDDEILLASISIWEFYDNKLAQVILPPGGERWAFHERAKWRRYRDELGKEIESEFGITMESKYIDRDQYRLPRVDPIVEAAKEAKEQEEDRKRMIQNQATGALLRAAQNKNAETARRLAMQQTMIAQNEARVQATQKSSTALQDELTRIKEATAASVATRAQRVESFRALTEQKAAVASAEAEQKKAILASSAQVLAEQNAEVARLRAEALAKQAQIVKAPAATVGRRAKAPQVKFGGSKASGYVQKLIELDKLDPEAELFDADLIQDPSKYIQTQLYEKSGRVQQGIKKIKEIQQKNIVTKALKVYAQRWKTLFDASIDDVTKFATSWKRDGVEAIIYNPVLLDYLGFLYLMKKYKNDALIVKYEKYYESFTAGLAYEGGKDTLEGAVHIKNDIEEAIKSGKDVIVIPFTLKQKDFEKLLAAKDPTLSTHANMLIYRPKKNELELFEPHGDYSPYEMGISSFKMNDAIKKYFEVTLKTITAEAKRGQPFKYIKSTDLYLKDNWELLSADESAFYKGFQTTENEYQDENGLDYPGFCVMWSLFYLELVLKFPNIDGRTLIKKAHAGLMKQGGPKRFLQHILSYTEYFKNEINRIIKESGFNTEYDMSKMPGGKADANTERVLYNFIRAWYNDQIKRLMTKKRMNRYKKTGAGIPTE